MDFNACTIPPKNKRKSNQKSKRIETAAYSSLLSFFFFVFLSPIPFSQICLSPPPPSVQSLPSPTNLFELAS